MPSNASSSQGTSPGLFITAPFQKIDPFLHESLRQPTVDVAILTEARKILGSVEEIHARHGWQVLRVELSTDASYQQGILL